MSEKETSAEIASIAGRVLNYPSEGLLPRPGYSDLLADAKKLAASCLSQREVAPTPKRMMEILEKDLEIPTEICQKIYAAFKIAEPVEQGTATWDMEQGTWRDNMGNPIESPADVIQRQIDGDPLDDILDLTASHIISTGPAMGTVEANFEFYVDGYTLKSTDTVGEILATAPGGEQMVITSRSLTNFIERRMLTGNSDPL